MTTATDDAGTGFEKTTLDNGLRIVTSSMPHTRSVTACLFVGVGSRYEDDERAGLSHFIEHLVFKGTHRRPDPSDISGPVEAVGGDINAGTEHELTAYWSKVPDQHMEESLDLLVDMLRNSLYRHDDVEKERLVIYEEQRMMEDDPGDRVEVLIDGLLWPDHPLGREIGGTRESIARTTRDDILAHADRFYSPSNIVVSVAGKLSHDAVVRQISDLCGDWEPRDLTSWAPFEGGQVEPRLGLEYSGTQQAHLSIAVPGPSMTDPGRYALDLLSVVLGEGMSSRLFLEIREKRGLAYDVHSAVVYFRDCGALIVSSGTEPAQAYTTAEAILAEMGRLREGIPADEVERAKQLVAGRLLLRMEDSRAVASWMGGQEIFLGHTVEVDQVVEHVNAVTAEEVMAVANRLLTPDKLSMAVVGPLRGRKRLEKILAQGLS